MKAYAIANRKGGVGKTTTAVTLGVGLAQRGATVLIVDLDAQGSVAASLGIEPSAPNMTELLLGQAPASACAVAARGNLWVVTADDRLQQARMELATKEAAEWATRALASRMGGKRFADEPSLIEDVLNVRLAEAKEAFDFVLLDCPPSLDVLSDAVYRFADGAIVPVKPEYLSTTGTGQHTSTLLDAQTRGIDIKTAWVVPTFYRLREVLANEMLLALREAYGDRVATPIPQAAAIEQAPAAGGMTILEYAPDSPAARAYNDLVERVYHGGDF